MQRLAVKAAVAATTDLGQFSAIAAAYSIDRQREQIVPGAFGDTIQRWQASGKRVPLHWDHRAGAEHIIGEVDPATMRETEAGLYVEGTLDIHDSDLARQAWRSVKKNRIGLSFGYMVTADRKGADGVRELLGIDLYEITLTGAPANADTRVLGAKSMDLHPDLIGTAWDPVFADGSPVKGQAERKHVEQPIQIVSFEA